MHPFFLLGNGFAVDGYVLCLGLGWLVGGVIVVREAMRRGWPLDRFGYVLAGCLGGAALGSVVLSVLFSADPWEHLTSHAWVGRTVVGGIAGGWLGVEGAKRAIGWKQRTGDAFALGIPIGHAIGRVGCLFAGCCYGAPTSLPWGVRFPAGAPATVAQRARDLLPASALASLPVHPTQLYDAAFDLLLFALLWRLRDRVRAPGSLFRVYLLGYATFRFGCEFLRGDLPAGGIKPVQWLLLVAIARAGTTLWREEVFRRTAQNGQAA
jgi:phosphatidylglycerol:prolipoprotein diacylglycerol transferase